MQLRSALLFLALSMACATDNEAEEEAAALKAALPERLQADGSIHLSDEDRKNLQLEEQAAQEGELPEVVLRFGQVEVRPGEESQVMSPVTGKINKPLSVGLGATVVEGTTLLEILPVLGAAESITFSAQRADLEGQIKSAESELSAFKVQAARQRELALSGLVSTRDVEQAETSVATTSATLDALRKTSALQRTGSGVPITLKAPSSGVVASVDVLNGAVVSPGQVLVRIITPGPRWVEVSSPPDEPVGVAYEVYIGSRWLAVPLLSAGVVLNADGTRHDRLEIPMEAALSMLPGAVVKVRVAHDAARGVILPESAVVPEGDSFIVYVERAPNVFVLRKVHVAAWLQGKVRLSEGLTPGEKVVTRGVMALRGESLRADLKGDD